MATWRFSGGTVFDGKDVIGNDAVAEAIRVDLGLLRFGADVHVVLLAPEGAGLDLNDPRIVTVWARAIAGRHGQTMTTDAQFEPFDFGPSDDDAPPDPKLIY